MTHRPGSAAEAVTDASAPPGLEAAERANELAVGFRRLWELGVSTNRIVELTSDDPDEALRRVRVALSEMERRAGPLARRGAS